MKPKAMRAIPVLLLFTALTVCGRAGEASSEETDAPGEENAAAAQESRSHAAPAPAAAAAGEVPMTLSVSVGGRTYRASGRGECKHADPAAIYGVLSSMWMVGFNGGDDIEQLRLTVWRPESGGADQLGLAVRTASGTYEIDTVTGDGETLGGATATVEPGAQGGRVLVEGRGADGTPIRVDIQCSRFTGIESVGG